MASKSFLLFIVSFLIKLNQYMYSYGKLINWQKLLRGHSHLI
uniref:Uncharacterized protein n=1 Tax=Arundo donax TaxID=35708 RepID=A0A0A9QM82_ARUDO